MSLKPTPLIGNVTEFVSGFALPNETNLLYAQIGGREEGVTHLLTRASKTRLLGYNEKIARYFHRLKNYPALDT